MDEKFLNSGKDAQPVASPEQPIQQIPQPIQQPNPQFVQNVPVNFTPMTVAPMPAQPIPSFQVAPNNPRKFSVTEIIFAWLSLFAGYAICRAFPVMDNPLGNFLFIICLFAVSAIVLMVRGKKFGLLPALSAFSAVVVSTSLILCNNVMIHIFSFLYALIMYTYFVSSSMGNTVQKGASDFIFADFIKALFIMPFTSFSYLFRAARIKTKNSRNTKIIPKILLGVAIAIIPTVIIVSLLSYDEKFIELLEKIAVLDMDDILSHILSFGFGIPIGMYIFGLYISSADGKNKSIFNEQGCTKVSESVKIAPNVTILAAVVPILFLYGVFFVSQLEYYLSAFSGVLPKNFIYAEYAREGFFELCAVSAINFIIIVLISLFTRRNSQNKPSRTLRALVSLLSVSTLILIVTGISKMVLYIDSYGLTPKRVYATWFMAMLFCIFIVILLKQLVLKMKSVFISFAVFAVFFSALSVVNVDSFIAEYNVDRYLGGTLKNVDVSAMDYLGDSAVPSMVKLVKTLDERNGTNISNYELTYDYDDWGYQDEAERELPEKELYRKTVAFLKHYADAEEKGFFSMTVPYIKARASLKNIGILTNEI